jgi:DNA-binding response OmpR family regulator
MRVLLVEDEIHLADMIQTVRGMGCRLARDSG